MNLITTDRIEEAVACIAEEIHARVRERPGTTATSNRGLWTELTCCVLSSQVPYDLAKAAALRIEEAGVLCRHNLPEQEILRQELRELLSTPFSFDGSFRRYRFPNIRANQIAAGFCTVRERWGSLRAFLRHNTNPRDARLWLVQHVPGVGPKQASMFLRNAAGCFDLAILDRHVLQYMRAVKVCSVDELAATTIETYERYEIKLRGHARSFGHAVGLLDWAIWIVMRTASRIDPRWVS